ncbi:MAG: hypothetical protein IMF10_06655 [Proteobacteria bacterium]|nr:hypothetical protein [Pseudomonadota bacterium]
MAEYLCSKCNWTFFGIRRKRKNRCVRCGGRLRKSRPKTFGDSRVDEENGVREAEKE